MSDGSRAAGANRGADPPTLEERLRAVEDERDIRNLIVTYAQRLDVRDHRGYAALFARNGRWTGQMGDATGPEAIEAMLERAFGPTPESFHNTQSFHLVSNILIELAGDRARAESRLVYFVRNDENRPMSLLAGRYQDELVREDGHWRFAHRRVIGDIPTMEEAAEARQRERSE